MSDASQKLFPPRNEGRQQVCREVGALLEDCFVEACIRRAHVGVALHEDHSVDHYVIFYA